MPTPTSFDPSSLPNLTGFIVLITGGHSGLGLATTQALASKNATVYIASRSIPKAESAIKELEQEIPNAKVAVIEMDLSDLESVKRGAEEFVRKENELHILINNAGTMCPPYSETKQGFQIQFATNYFSHFLLTTLLAPLFFTTASITPPYTVRVITVSSDGHSKLAPPTFSPSSLYSQI